MSIGSILTIAGGVIVGAISLWLHGNRSGKISEINKQNKEVLNNVKTSKDAVDASNNSSVDEQLNSLLDDANGK